MAALIQRQTTGLGQKIDCSLLASQVFIVVCYYLINDYINCLVFYIKVHLKINQQASYHVKVVNSLSFLKKMKILWV